MRPTSLFHVSEDGSIQRFDPRRASKWRGWPRAGPRRLAIHGDRPFALLDASAGYFVARQPVEPLGVRRIDDPLAEPARHDVELRVMPSLWKLYDAVIASPRVSYSAIRMRNAQPHA